MAESAIASAGQRVSDALRAAACLSLDPGLGGVVLRADPVEVGEQWLAILGSMLPEATVMRRVPLHVDAERLSGGVDLTATLRLGRKVVLPGLLQEMNGGVIVLASAERIRPQLAAQIGSVLDRGVVDSLRDGELCEVPVRVAVVALDNRRATDERGAPALLERLGVHLDLNGLTEADLAGDLPDRGEIRAAGARLAAVTSGESIVRALCVTAMACGIVSVRAPWFALRVACASAALDGREEADAEDLQFAARIVLAPRATVNPGQTEAAAPQTPSPTAEPPPSAEPRDDSNDRSDDASLEAPSAPKQDSAALEDQLLAAARAAIPHGLLAQLQAPESGRQRSGSVGRAGVSVMARRRGRPAGVRAGHPNHGARLNVFATLRAAAPWQALRRAEASVPASRVLVRVSDFRVTWFRQRTETVTVFALDASGSSALHRLAEAKGAVELLLAECYVRRDQVAVCAFRGRQAELLLAPTRSLVRVKRCLGDLPGGGATPLAAGIDAARGVAEQVLRRGQSPLLVLLTDGHANVARDGTSGRAHAEADALLASRRVFHLGLKSLLIDTAQRPQLLAQRLAERMGARYLPLPHADSRTLVAAVRAAG